MKKPLLKKLHKLDSIPLLSASLRRLIQLEEDNELSTHELSVIILDDCGLINKVLQTVNAFYYNRLGKEIKTVTQAVVLLGFNTVKKIALSMAVLELMGEDASKDAITEIGKAFLAARLAQTMGKEYGSYEPEEIFICTLFRHLPRIAMAIGNPGLLAEIQGLETSKKSEDRLKAKRMVRDLGYKLCRHWKLPKTLAGYLEGCGSISGSSTPAYRTLARDVSLFVNLRYNGGPEDELISLEEELTKNYHLETESLDRVLSRALKETKETVPGIKDVLHAEFTAISPAGIQISEKTGQEAKKEADALLQSSLEKERLFTELVQNLMSSINSMDTGLDQIYLLAIEILRRVINTGNIIFCKVSSDRRGFSAGFGMGDHAGLLKRTLFFHLEGCARELRDAFIHQRETILCWKDLPGMEGSVPENVLARPILLAPLVIEGTNIGCLILDKSMGSRFQPDEIQKTSIIRQLVVTATSLRARKRTCVTA